MIARTPIRDRQLLARLRAFNRRASDISRRHRNQNLLVMDHEPFRQEHRRWPKVSQQFSPWFVNQYGITIN